MSEPRYVYLRVTRPEGYEDVHPDLILDDLHIADCWQAEVADAPASEVKEAAERLRGVIDIAHEGCGGECLDCLVWALLAALDRGGAR